MKIAVLILAHQYPEILRRLIAALDDPRFDIFVHVDAKCRLSDFHFESYQLQHSKLTLTKKRHWIFWADYSMVEAMLTLYREALAQGEYDRFILLSGEDYPLQSNDRICEALAASSTDRIRLCDDFMKRRVARYWFYLIRNRKLVQKFGTALHLLGIRKNPVLTVDGKQWEVMVSSQWCALTRRSVEYILDTLDRYPEIKKYFRFSYAPDELVIPTILRNAPFFEEEMASCLHRGQTAFEERAATHFIQYHRQHDSSVAVFDESIFEEARNSGKLFLRKVRPGTSDRLMDLIDQARREE